MARPFDPHPLRAPRQVPRYLSHADVARRIGVKSRRSVSVNELPAPDVMVASCGGWHTDTIDEWHSRRPGRGVKVDHETAQPRPIVRYLSHADVARRIGVKSRRSVSVSELPPHDVEVGSHRGWLEVTIDSWHAQRPGRGWHNGRPGAVRVL